MKCIIAGSRGITDYDLVEKAFTLCTLSGKIVEIVSGTAAGVDRLGERLAFAKDLRCAHFPADWSRYGRGAGHIRNSQMADYADIAIILWDGKSKGTKNMIENMNKRKKPCFVYLVKNNKLKPMNKTEQKLPEGLFKI